MSKQEEAVKKNELETNENLVMTISVFEDEENGGFGTRIVTTKKGGMNNFDTYCISESVKSHFDKILNEW